MQDDMILKINQISKAFGGVQALDKVDLTIRKGEIHCLAGGNGSGKSTLIKIVSGFYQPDEGYIEINGHKYNRLTPKESIMQGIQVIYQDLSIFPNLTVAENISLNYELYNENKFVNWRKVDEIAQLAMDKIGVKFKLGEMVENLSIADKQLIAISRALLHDAKLIIMDEPTTALTRKEIKKLFEIIRKLQESGVSILFVSHKLNEVFEIAENFTILRDGRKVITDSTTNVDNRKFIQYMTGREIEADLFIPEHIECTKPIFRVEKLGLKNGFADISFSVYPGEILGITGLLGSGRTELAKSLFGLYPAETGSIYINEQNVVISSPQDALKNKIAYVPEDRLSEGLALEQSISKNLAISNIDNLQKKDKTIDYNQINKDVAYWKDELSIKMNDPNDSIQVLSGGNQQKVVLAKWLEINPKVLILNGPTVGVDIGAKHDLHNYLRNLAESLSVAIIIISDDIPEIIQNCNRIIIMKQGRISSTIRNIDTNEDELLELITKQA